MKLLQEIHMNREQIIDYVQQVQTMLQQLGDLQKNINQGKAIKEILESQGEAERALKMAKDLATVQASYDTATQAVMRKCKKGTVQACETMLGDIVERLKLADKAFDTWRALAAAHDLDCQLSDDVEARRARETMIEAEKTRYEKAIELAGSIVSAPGVVLL